MPTYEYRCKFCDHNFEIQQSISDNPLTECPLCEGDVARIIGKNIGIRFVGSGFYVNDSAGAK